MNKKGNLVDLAIEKTVNEYLEDNLNTIEKELNNKDYYPIHLDSIKKVVLEKYEIEEAKQIAPHEFAKRCGLEILSSIKEKYPDALSFNTHDTTILLGDNKGIRDYYTVREDVYYPSKDYPNLVYFPVFTKENKVINIVNEYSQLPLVFGSQVTCIQYSDKLIKKYPELEYKITIIDLNHYYQGFYFNNQSVPDTISIINQSKSDTSDVVYLLDRKGLIYNHLLEIVNNHQLFYFNFNENSLKEYSDLKQLDDIQYLEFSEYYIATVDKTWEKCKNSKGKVNEKALDRLSKYLEDVKSKLTNKITKENKNLYLKSSSNCVTVYGKKCTYLVLYKYPLYNGDYFPKHVYKELSKVDPIMFTKYQYYDYYRFYQYLENGTIAKYTPHGEYKGMQMTVVNKTLFSLNDIIRNQNYESNELKENSLLQLKEYTEQLIYSVFLNNTLVMNHLLGKVIEYYPHDNLLTSIKSNVEYLVPVDSDNNTKLGYLLMYSDLDHGEITDIDLNTVEVNIDSFNKKNLYSLREESLQLAITNYKYPEKTLEVTQSSSPVLYLDQENNYHQVYIESNQLVIKDTIYDIDKNTDIILLPFKSRLISLPDNRLFTVSNDNLIRLNYYI